MEETRRRAMELEGKDFKKNRQKDTTRVLERNKKEHKPFGKQEIK